MIDIDIPDYDDGEVWPQNEDQEKLLEFDEKAKPFHIGQGCGKKGAQVLKCRKCDGNEFHVAQGDYYTAIRCINCEWECCIHSG